MIFRTLWQRFAAFVGVRIDTVNVFYGNSRRPSVRKAISAVENRQRQLPRPALQIRLGPIRQDPPAASVKGNFQWKQITDELGAQRKR